MNKKIMLLVASITFVMLLSNIQDSEAIRGNEEYVILSEKYFVVFSTDEAKKISPIDGGIFYNDKWQMFNMTNIVVEQGDDEGDLGWIIGHLKSGERFWFTWNLTINSDVVTGAWVYDGEILTEMTDYKAYMTRLFF